MNCNKAQHDDVEASYLMANLRRWAMVVPKFLLSKVVSWVQAVKKVGKDDPRRIIHAVKVGLAIIAASLFYYVHPLYKNLGDSVMWAVISVVVVFEYTVGGTLGKGVNRMVSTLLAGVTAVLVHNLANFCGGSKTIVAFVFLVAVIFSFIRFIPKLKAKFDYGLMIFILTFSLVSISALGGHDVKEVATKRLVNIIMGSSIAVIVCICICPVWNGVELHNLILGNLDKLASFLEQGFDVDVMTMDKGKVKSDVSSISSSYLQQFKIVLDSTKTTEENMANLASWEPTHGQFRFRHPWKLYLKVGNLTRQCAYKINVLNTYLSNSDLQTSLEFTKDLQCVKHVSLESGKALRELSRGLRKTKLRVKLARHHIYRSKVAVEELNNCLLQSTAKRLTLLSQEDDHHQFTNNNLSNLMGLATTASLLREIVACVDEIVEVVHELASSAGFNADDGGSHVAPCCSDDDNDCITTRNYEKMKTTSFGVACNNHDDHIVIKVTDDDLTMTTRSNSNKEEGATTTTLDVNHGEGKDDDIKRISKQVNVA